MQKKDFKKMLLPAERHILQKLSNPQRIQDYLDTLPINFELSGETYMSPRRVLNQKTAHCFEGALLAAGALLYHGQKAFLLDLRTIPRDEDHVVTLFAQNGYWGAISKTNHTILRYRDPVYKTPRELAISYFHEYLMADGTKSLRAFSKPFDMSKIDPAKWMTTDQELHWLVEKLDRSRHFPVAHKKNFRLLRKASRIECDVLQRVEWKLRRDRKEVENHSAKTSSHQ